MKTLYADVVIYILQRLCYMYIRGFPICHLSVLAVAMAVAMESIGCCYGLLRCILIGCCIVYIAWFCLLIFSISCPDKYKV